MGIVIGACLVNPAFINILSNSEPLYTLFDGSVIASPVYFSLLGIPVLLMNYSQTVIPIIFAVFFSRKIREKIESYSTKSVTNVCSTYANLINNYGYYIPICWSRNNMD